jgi:hypothetical protein
LTERKAPAARARWQIVASERAALFDFDQRCLGICSGIATSFCKTSPARPATPPVGSYSAEHVPRSATALPHRAGNRGLAGPVRLDLPFLPWLAAKLRKDGSQMRRRLQKFLPIVLIALAMQILAPVAACWATGLAAADPLQSAAICHDAAADQAPSGKTGNPAHDGACAICCVLHAAAVLDTPKSTSHGIVLNRDPQRIAWVDAATHLPPSRASSDNKARAPPHLT